MIATSSLLHDAALAAERFAKLAIAQLDHPSAPLALRVEDARAGDRGPDDPQARPSGWLDQARRQEERHAAARSPRGGRLARDWAAMADAHERRAARGATLSPAVGCTCLRQRLTLCADSEYRQNAAKMAAIDLVLWAFRW